jgi:hypothetical protein
MVNTNVHFDNTNGMVKYLAKIISKAKLPFKENIGEAWLLMKQTENKFDDNQKVKFTSFAWKRIYYGLREQKEYLGHDELNNKVLYWPKVDAYVQESFMRQKLGEMFDLFFEIEVLEKNYKELGL